MRKSLVVFLILLLVFVFLGCSSSNSSNSTRKYSLETGIIGEGQIEVDPDNTTYKESTEVKVTAVADENYQFANWSGNLEGTSISQTITMTDDTNIIAVFEAKKDLIKVYYNSNWDQTYMHYSLEGENWTSLPGKKMEQSSKFPDYEVIEVNIKGADYIKAAFNNGGDQWDNNKEEDYTIRNKVSTIKHGEINSGEPKEIPFKLNVGKNGSVIVTKEDGTQITVEDEYTLDLKDNQTESLTLEANPKKENWTFEGWTGDYIGEEEVINIDVTNDMVVKANFIKSDLFKIVNSWGANWGPNNDGTLYMTYDAAKQVGLKAYIMEPRNNYQPSALALFEVAGDNRKDWEFTIKIPGRNGKNSKTFYPESIVFKGGSHEFPNNKLALDITELMPFETEDIVLEVNNNSGTSGKIKSFAIEVNNETYTAEQSNVSVAAGSTEEISILRVKASSSDMEMLSAEKTLHPVSRELTVKDVKKFSAESSNQYSIRSQNNRTNGYGTGLKEMTKEEWNKAKQEGSIRVLEAEKVLSNFDSSFASGGRERIDYTDSKHFPPIGNQGIEGSCVAWSMAYYQQGFYQARNNNWDLTTRKDNYLLSPDFVYHLINNGENKGTLYTDNTRIITSIGVASLAEMPYDDSNSTRWPSESAFREAPKNRTAIPGSKDHTVVSNSTYFIEIQNDSDIEAIKTLLKEGYLISISIDSKQYSNLTQEGIWNAENYTNPETDHANTIVGFY